MLKNLTILFYFFRIRLKRQMAGNSSMMGFQMRQVGTPKNTHNIDVNNCKLMGDYGEVNEWYQRPEFPVNHHGRPKFQLHFFHGLTVWFQLKPTDSVIEEKHCKNGKYWLGESNLLEYSNPVLRMTKPWNDMMVHKVKHWSTSKKTIGSQSYWPKHIVFLSRWFLYI